MRVYTGNIKVYQSLLNSAKYMMHINVKQDYFNAQEVAKILGISKQTLIRYEKKGVFPESRRNPVNQWREYTESDLTRLKTILGRA